MKLRSIYREKHKKKSYNKNQSKILLNSHINGETFGQVESRKHDEVFV